MSTPEKPIIITKTITEKNMLYFTRAVVNLLKDTPYLLLQEAFIEDGAGHVEFTAKFKGQFIPVYPVIKEVQHGT